MSGLSLKTVILGRPRSQCSSRNIQNALRASLVPIVVEECEVVAVRCVFDFMDKSEAVKQLAARRKQLEDKLRELPEVIFSFKCILSEIFRNILFASKHYLPMSRHAFHAVLFKRQVIFQYYVILYKSV